MTRTLMTPRNARWGRRLGRIALVGAALAIAGCAADAPQDFLQPAGEFARRVDGLWNLVFPIAVAVFVIVQGLLVYAIVRFRHRPGGEEPRQVHGHTRMEIAWTIAPAVLLAFVAAPTIATIFELSGEPPDALQVTVTAHQWWWEYEYTDEDVVTANELHIPVGRPVYLKLLSGDIIHSFWVPKLAGKQDVIPGRESNLWLDADEPGEYFGQCAEFCGLSHANMRLRVFAHPPDEFEDWLEMQRREAESPPAGDAAEGERIFMEAQCVACHTVRGTDAQGIMGPDLTHLASRTTIAGAIFDNTPESLRRWIRNAPGEKPGALMPTAGEMGLSDEQIEMIVAYLQTLR